MSEEPTVQMRAVQTFTGDGFEGLHPIGSTFYTTPIRATKYERNLPRLAMRVKVLSKRHQVPMLEETKKDGPKKTKQPVKKKARKSTRKKASKRG